MTRDGKAEHFYLKTLAHFRTSFDNFARSLPSRPIERVRQQIGKIADNRTLRSRQPVVRTLRPGAILWDSRHSRVQHSGLPSSIDMDQLFRGRTCGTTTFGIRKWMTARVYLNCRSRRRAEADIAAILVGYRIFVITRLVAQGNWLFEAVLVGDLRHDSKCRSPCLVFDFPFEDPPVQRALVGYPVVDTGKRGTATATLTSTVFFLLEATKAEVCCKPLQYLLLHFFVGCGHLLDRWPRHQLVDHRTRLAARHRCPIVRAGSRATCRCQRRYSAQEQR